LLFTPFVYFGIVCIISFISYISHHTFISDDHLRTYNNNQAYRFLCDAFCITACICIIPASLLVCASLFIIPEFIFTYKIQKQILKKFANKSRVILTKTIQ
jgi:hypothetical protein